MKKNITTDELVITNQLLIFKVVAPALCWLVFAAFLFFIPLSNSWVHNLQIYSGCIFYFVLFLALNNGANKIISPDYSYKFAPLFFGGVFGSWLAVYSFAMGLNGLIGLILMYCSINTLLFWANMKVASNGGYLEVNEVLFRVISYLNILLLACCIISSAINLAGGPYVWFLM